MARSILYSQILTGLGAAPFVSYHSLSFQSIMRLDLSYILRMLRLTRKTKARKTISYPLSKDEERRIRTISVGQNTLEVRLEEAEDLFA